MIKFGSIVKGMTVAGAIAFASSALADGFSRGSLKDRGPIAAPFSWTGFYLGAHAGFGWSQENVGSTCTGPTPCNQAPGASNVDGSGFIGGLHAGYNLQAAPSWVIGIEGDFSWTNIDGSGSDANRTATGVLAPPGVITWSRNIDWLASVRARLGYVVAPNALLYLTGGVAWQKAELSGFNSAPACPLCATGSASETRVGYVIGAGLEWALNRNWLLRGEYLYYSFEDANFSAPFASAPTFLSNFGFRDSDLHTLRAGISYKF